MAFFLEAGEKQMGAAKSRAHSFSNLRSLYSFDPLVTAKWLLLFLLQNKAVARKVLHRYLT
jgi:hypothetical protein